MVSGTLYTYSGSFRANKILITAAYSGSNVTVPDFEYGKTNTSQEFLKKFPLGKVPAFESEGLFLNESDAIAQYLSNEALLGGDNVASRAAVQEYISFTESEIVPSACTWVYPTLGWTQYNKQETEDAMNNLKKCFEKLNNDLLTKTFLVGERITLADITLSTALVMLYVQVLDKNFRSAYGNLNRWFETCVNQPNFKKVLGDIKLCEKMAVFDKNRYAELNSKKGKDKKQEKSKDQKKSEPKKPAETKPAEPKPAKVDFFADVPKSNFNFDEWKKTYNNASVEESTKWFADNMDDEAISIWYGEREPEVQPEHHVESYICGMKERLDSLRKHMHGIFLTFKLNEENLHQIVMVIICKGTTLIFDRNEDWQTDSCYFNWEKVDKAQNNEMLKKYFYDGMNKKGEKASSYAFFV